MPTTVATDATSHDLPWPCLLDLHYLNGFPVRTPPVPRPRPPPPPPAPTILGICRRVLHCIKKRNLRRSANFDVGFPFHLLEDVHIRALPYKQQIKPNRYEYEEKCDVFNQTNRPKGRKHAEQHQTRNIGRHPSVSARDLAYHRNNLRPLSSRNPPEPPHILLLLQPAKNQFLAMTTRRWTTVAQYYLSADAHVHIKTTKLG